MYEVWTDAGRNTPVHPCGGKYVIARFTEIEDSSAFVMELNLQGHFAEARPSPVKSIDPMRGMGHTRDTQPT